MGSAIRQELINAANEVFSYFGYKKASIEDIARIAGVGKGAMGANLRVDRRWIASFAPGESPPETPPPIGVNLTLDTCRILDWFWRPPRARASPTCDNLAERRVVSKLRFTPMPPAPLSTKVVEGGGEILRGLVW